jgi:hypothetical protein
MVPTIDEQLAATRVYFIEEALIAAERTSVRRRAHEAYQRKRREEEARWFRDCLKALR